MPRASLKNKTVPDSSDAATLAFMSIAKAFTKDRRVTRGGRFGGVSLRSNEKVFAMLFKGKFVAKLSPSRVTELVASGKAKRFDPGHGRLMKEWIEITGHRSLWAGLAKEARVFVDPPVARRTVRKRTN